MGSLGASTIIGDFDGYIIDYSNGQQTSGGHTIEKLTIINSHATGGGIRLGSAVGGAIRDCDITANRGISTDGLDMPIAGSDGGGGSGGVAFFGSLEITVNNCRLQAHDALADGSWGLARGADGSTVNCIFKNYHTGVRNFAGEGCMSYHGCYFEVTITDWLEAGGQTSQPIT